jgi:hypothetical protein
VRRCAVSLQGTDIPWPTVNVIAPEIIEAKVLPSPHLKFAEQSHGAEYTSAI